jgi:hypothetical protein
MPGDLIAPGSDGNDDTEHRMWRVYATVSVPISMETLARDGSHAWEIVSHPSQRIGIAQRLRSASAESLAQVMELQGFAERRDGQPTEAIE